VLHEVESLEARLARRAPRFVCRKFSLEGQFRPVSELLPGFTASRRRGCAELRGDYGISYLSRPHGASVLLARFRYGVKSCHVQLWDRGVHITNYLAAPSEVLARRFPIEAGQDKIGQDMARQDKATQELNKSLRRHSLCQKNNQKTKHLVAVGSL
jgi:hypothetical protein